MAPEKGKFLKPCSHLYIVHNDFITIATCKSIARFRKNALRIFRLRVKLGIAGRSAQLTPWKWQRLEEYLPMPLVWIGGLRCIRLGFLLGFKTTDLSTAFFFAGSRNWAPCSVLLLRCQAYVYLFRNELSTCKQLEVKVQGLLGPTSCSERYTGFS